MDHALTTARARVRVRPSLLVAAALGLLWAVAEPRTADLAAQVYRTDLFVRGGFTLWDNAWFAGHQLLGYSLVFPAVASAVGLRTIGLVAVAVSVLCVDDLVARLRPLSGRAPGAWFAAVAVGDLFIGRLTFALGMAVALAACVAVTRERALLGALLCAACAATSPVVGLFLALVLVAALGHVPRRTLALSAVGLASTLAATTLLFGDGGRQPDDLAAAVAGTAIAAAAWALIDDSERFLRRAVGLYAVATVAVYLLPTPIGSNIARLGVLALGPALLCARRRGGARALVPWLCAVAVWQLWAPVTETLKAQDSGATSAAYFAPLIRQLHVIHASDQRIEVVPTSTRWESVYVALQFPMARGWETQLDRRYNGVFYHRVITPAAYRRWLDRLRVGYVAVSDSAPERWGVAEKRLLAAPPGYLRPVWRDAHWRLFAVAHPRPIVSGATLTSFGATGLGLRFSRPGTAEVAVHDTPYWHASAGGCVQPGPSSGIRVTAHRAGVVTLTTAWHPAAFVDHDGCA